MPPIRRSTRERYAPGSRPKPAHQLPKLPSQEAPEPWPPKNLATGLIYHPPPSATPCAKEAKKSKRAVSSSASSSPSLSRGSSEETLVNSDDAASGSTLSARSSSEASAAKSDLSRGRGGCSEEIVALNPEYTQEWIWKAWGQRRREREEGMYEKGEPTCEGVINHLRTVVRR